MTDIIDIILTITANPNLVVRRDSRFKREKLEF